MSEFKKGDRVLVEGYVASEHEGQYRVNVLPYSDKLNFSTDDGDEGFVHPHPGVPVSDLLEELRLRDELFDRKYPLRADRLTVEDQVQTLREAREAAQAPKHKEGEEVWVRAFVSKASADAVMVNLRVNDSASVVKSAVFHPDDIRKVEE